jgi:hypothetical protein
MSRISVKRGTKGAGIAEQREGRPGRLLGPRSPGSGSQPCNSLLHPCSLAIHALLMAGLASVEDSEHVRYEENK